MPRPRAPIEDRIKPSAEFALKMTKRQTTPSACGYSRLNCNGTFALRLFAPDSLARKAAARLALATALIKPSAVLPAVLGLGLSLAPLWQVAHAQEACCFVPSYRLQCETVMQPQTVQRFRIAYETETVEEEVVSYRPVLKTRTEEREYRVARPVTETSYREERYTIYRPVTETSYRDEQYTQTRYVTETAEREEQVTTYKPVTETQVYQQQYTVQRPVVETEYRQQQYQVQRPVVETQYQTQQQIAYRPVTSVQNQTIDAGGYVAQQVIQPGQVGYGLQYIPRAVQTTGPLGIFSVNRGATFWVPQVTPPTVQTQMVYRPNLITQQVAQTSYVPEVQQQQVPVQVMRMQTETVTQEVPVQVTRMQSEIVSQEVPVQTTRMVPTVEVRKTPYTVQRPITETLTRRVPVQEQKWVTEEQVRRVPVTSTRIEYETRREPVQIQYYEQEKIIQKVQRPVTRQVYVPYTETVMVPRQVVQRAPLSYYDPFAPAIVSGYSSLGSPVVVTPAAPPAVVSSRPATNGDAAGRSVLENGSESAEDRPKPRVGGVDISSPSDQTDQNDQQSQPSEDQPSQQSDQQSTDEPSDLDELQAPVLDANEASYRIQYRPLFARQI